MKTLLVTGGAGFIGSNYVRHALQAHGDYRVINLDKLTYAGNLANLADVEGEERYEFVRGDIANAELVDHLMSRVDLVVNFAAETHVDRSIMGAADFMSANAVGAHCLLEAARRHGVERFLQVSTDEVYGSLGPDEPPWTEGSPLAPRNPYSVSKACGDMMARAFFATHGLPVIVTRASNSIGPYQYPEKRVPLFITNALDDQPLPVYGRGGAVRDHLYVTDHCAGIDLALHRGQPGEAYNIGAENEADGLQVTRRILELLGKPAGLMQFVPDRPGHDMRYAMDSSRLRGLGWRRQYDFDAALEQTVRWYVDHEGWWRPIRSGSDFRAYFERQYGARPGA